MKPMYLSIRQKETGKQIRKLLQENGYSVRDIQDVMGFENPQAIYKWLSGKSLPSLDNFIILSKVLHTSIEDILVVDGDIVHLEDNILNQQYNDKLMALTYTHGKRRARMTNYWKFRSFSFFSACYAYVDHKDYLADALFAAENIPVRFKGEMVKEKSPYCVVFCKVWKKDSDRFENALQQMNNKMLLCGHTDYPEICAALTDAFENERKATV